MTEKEKKAIEKIKLDISKPLACKGITICDVDDLIKLLKLIEKLQSDIEIKDKVIKELENKLEEHIKFCEQEAIGHIENNVCHISLKFEKRLLEEIKKVEEEKC